MPRKVISPDGYLNAFSLSTSNMSFFLQVTAA